jgi:hypothetical protein
VLYGKYIMVHETWHSRWEYLGLPVGTGNKQVEFIQTIIRLLQTECMYTIV